MKNAHLPRRQQHWGEWQVIAVIKEINAAKGFVKWYRELDDPGLEVRCVVWQPPTVMEDDDGA